MPTLFETEGFLGEGCFPSTMLIIGIAGKMRAGKSTLAHRLSNYFGCEIIPWAEAVRREVSRAWFGNYTPEKARAMWLDLESRDKARTRPILQAWGHGKRVVQHENYWIKKWLDIAEAKHRDMVIIDDVRYGNEVGFIMDNGGLLIRLDCDSNTLADRGADIEFLEHDSENSLADLTLHEAGPRWNRVLRLNSANLDSDELMQTTLEWLWDANYFRNEEET